MSPEATALNARCVQKSTFASLAAKPHWRGALLARKAAADLEQPSGTTLSNRWRLHAAPARQLATALPCNRATCPNRGPHGPPWARSVWGLGLFREACRSGIPSGGVPGPGNRHALAAT